MSQISELKSSFNVFKLANFKILKFTFYAIASIAFLLVSFSAFSQAPAAIPYQAVARDVNGNLLAGQAISLRLSLRNLTSAGTVVYSETKSTTTNSFGLFNINIGEGTPLTGTLAGVNWSNGAKFIQVEMDASGGTNYVDMGTTQMMSVPYALFAAKAGNLPNGTANGSTMRWNGTAWVADNNIYNSGGNVGIGTTTPATKLDVAGTTKTTNLQMTNNGGFGKVMISDANGNASWSPSTSLSITELDPQVNSVISNQIPKWNGTTLNDGIITDNGTNIGIGTTTPTTKLDVAGTTKTTNLQLPTGAGAGKVLQSDATGNASWVNSTSLPITELDPQVGTLSNNKVPKWNGSTLTDGVMYDNGTNVGIGTPTPTLPLTVRSLVVDTFENVASLANANVDPAFQLNTTRGDVTNTSGSVMTQIGQAYNGNPPTEAVRFHRGSTSTNGAISITTAKTERMRIMNNGNIGIGTTAPRGIFDVQKHGDIYLSDSTNSGSDQYGYLPGNVVLAPYNGTNLSYLTARRENTTGSNELQLRTVNNGTTINAMRIDSAGNIGIGTTNPMNKLDIEGGVAIGAGYSGSNIAPTNGAIIQGNVGLGTGTQTPMNKLDVEGGIAIGAGYSGTNVAPTNGAIIQGNVGIGTSDARALLDLGTTVANRKIILNASQDNSHQFTGFGVNATAPGNNLRYQIDSTGGNHTFHAATSPTTSAELMRISGTGNVGIGTTAPTQKLDVAGTTRTTAFQMPTGAANNFVLKSDATGNASWTNLSTIGLAETDPKVGTLSLNKIPKWNGTALADGVLFDNGTNIGVGTLTPTTKLDVVGTTKTTAFQLPTGAGVNKVLQSDATGNASWVNLSSITVSETDPKVGTLLTSKVPRWNGTTLANGTITDDGTEVGLGIATPTSRLHIKSEGNSTVPLTIEKSNSTNPIFTVTQGSGTGNGFVGVYDNLGIEGSRIHSTNDSWVGSNLGVGTSTPRGVFDVQKHGDIYLADSTVNGTDQVLFAPGNLRMVPWNGGNVSYLQVSRADLSGTSELQLRTSAGGNYVDAMRIDELGRVGIGTLNPANKLDVSGTIRTNDIIISTGAAAGKILTSDATGNASWELPPASETDPQVGALSINNVPRWNGTALITGTITDIASNVGIGTATPLNRLDVAGGMAIGSNYAGSWSIGSNNVAIEGKLSVGTPTMTNGLNISSNAAIGNGYEMLNAPTNGAIIKGNVGIGTSSPANKLDVEGGIAIGTNYSGSNFAPFDGAIIQGNVGIGNTSPTTKLDVSGTVKALGLQVTNGAVPGYFLKSIDGLGNAQWAAPSALINETDPQVNCNVTYRIPVNIGNTLEDGTMVDYANNIGIGVTNPTSKLQIFDNTNTTPSLQITSPDHTGIGLLSGQSWQHTSIMIGRGDYEGRIGIAAAADHFLLHSQAGDMVIRTEAPDRSIILGTDYTKNPALHIKNNKVYINNLGITGAGSFTSYNPYSVFDVTTQDLQATIHGNATSVGGFPLFVGGAQNGILIEVSATSNANNNFIQFDDFNGTKGAIEGQSYADLQGNWEYAWFYTHHALAAASLAASTACNVLGTTLPPLPAFACQVIVDGIQIADEVADWVLYAVEMENNYGITYKSGGADYAEWMPRTNITETLVAGDVVGVKDGHISKSTTNADQLMVISTAPMVLGNTPEKNRENDYNKVAFMGQVPVKVNGMVKSGDYVLCSGYEDGYAYAKNEATMKASDYKYIVGIAWADKKTEGIGFVNTAVGVNSNKLSGRMANMQEENETLKNQILSIASYLQSKDPSFNISLPTQTKTEEVKVAKANPQQDIAQVQIGFIDIIGEIKANPDHYTKIFKSVKAEVIKRGINLDKAPEIRDMLNDADSYIKGLEKYQRLLKEKTEAMNAQPDHK